MEILDNRQKNDSGLKFKDLAPGDTFMIVNNLAEGDTFIIINNLAEGVFIKTTGQIYDNNSFNLKMPYNMTCIPELNVVKLKCQLIIVGQE